MLKNKKILPLLVIVIVVIIAGMVMLFVRGMNYGLLYGENTSVELYLESDFEKSDIQNIITEVFGNNIKIRQVNDLEHDILIITKSVSDEQLNILVSKVNEKYNLELKTEDLLVMNNSKLSGTDLISPYIMPVCITALLILAYFIIRYKKIGILKITLFTILTIIFVQLIYISIYSITRLPINEYTMPVSMILYLISVILLTEKFERDLQKLKQEQ